MPFSYDLSNGFTDLTRVRFHLSDTDANAPKFQDDEISAIITESGSWQKAVLACIRSLMARMTTPNFKADWLTMDVNTAYNSLTDLLRQKQREFGLSSLTVTTVHVYRADGQMTASPTFAQSDEDDASSGSSF